MKEKPKSKWGRTYGKEKILNEKCWCGRKLSVCENLIKKNIRKIERWRKKKQV
jgi:hypothetical protein